VILAHLGHVLVDLPLYGGPVIGLLGALFVVRRMGGIEQRPPDKLG
jgi:hypothetical protein